MKSVKNSSIGEKEGGGHGPPTKLEDGIKKRSVNLWGEGEREREEGEKQGGREGEIETRYARYCLAKGSRLSSVILNLIDSLCWILRAVDRGVVKSELRFLNIKNVICFLLTSSIFGGLSFQAGQLDHHCRHQLPLLQVHSPLHLLLLGMMDSPDTGEGTCSSECVCVLCVYTSMWCI